MPELIDRDAALKLAYHNYYPSIDHLCCSVKCATYDELEALPTIDAEPVRHGRWIEETEPDENGNVISMCDQCCHTDEHCINIKVPHCWYCGARMRQHDQADSRRPRGNQGVAGRAKIGGEQE